MHFSVKLLTLLLRGVIDSAPPLQKMALNQVIWRLGLPKLIEFSNICLINDKLTFLGARGPPGDLWTSLLILTIPLLVLEGPCLKMNNSCSQKTNKMQISANWINIEEWWITLVLRCCVQMLSVIIAPPRKQHLSTKLFLIPQYWFSLQRSAFDYFLRTTIVHLQTWPLKDQWTG